MDMLVKIKDMAKSMYSNGIYDYVPDLRMVINKDENGLHDVVVLELENFEGKGSTVEEAFKKLKEDYVTYLRNEMDDQQALLDALNI